MTDKLADAINNFAETLKLMYYYELKYRGLKEKDHHGLHSGEKYIILAEEFAKRCGLNE